MWHVNPDIQKYKFQKAPPGYGVLYAIFKKDGSRKAYIGRAACKTRAAQYRIFGSRGHIKGNSRCKSLIHDAISKYGWDAFDWLIIDLLPENILDNAEVEAIRYHQTLHPNGYNIEEGGNTAKPSKESIARFKATKAAWSPDQKLANSEAIKKAFTQERKMRQSIGQKARWKTDAFRKKMDGVSKKWWGDRTAEERHELGKKIHAERLKKKKKLAIETAIPLPPPGMRKHKAFYRYPDGSIRTYYLNKTGGNSYVVVPAVIN